MAISDTLSSMAANISAAYGQINTMGGTIPLSKNLENLPSAIGTIPTGGGGGTDYLPTYFNKQLSVFSYSDVYNVPSYAFNNYQALTEVNLPNCSTIYASAFQDCFNLSKVTLASNTSIYPAYCFYNCSALTDINLNWDVIETIGTDAFYSTPISPNFGSNGESIYNFPKLYSVGASAFNPNSVSWNSINTLTFSTSSSISINMNFLRSTAINNIYAPNAASLWFYASYSPISVISCPGVITPRLWTCGDGGTLYINGPVTSIVTGANTRTLSAINYSAVHIGDINQSINMSVAAQAFNGTGTFLSGNIVKEIHLYCGSIITFGSSAFLGNTSLYSIYLHSPNVATAPASTSAAMNSMFSGLPNSYSVFVPSSLYTSYTRATGWSRITSHLASIPE